MSDDEVETAIWLCPDASPPRGVSARRAYYERFAPLYLKARGLVGLPAPEGDLHVPCFPILIVGSCRVVAAGLGEEGVRIGPYAIVASDTRAAEFRGLRERWRSVTSIHDDERMFWDYLKSRGWSVITR